MLEATKQPITLVSKTVNWVVLLLIAAFSYYYASIQFNPLLFNIVQLVLLVLVFLVIKLVIHFYKIRTNTPLQNIPGPWLASCSHLYRFWYAVIKGNFHHDLTNLHRKYGDIVRIAPNEVSIWDPQVVSEIYAHDNKGYAKCDMYDIALPNGFFNLAVERDIAVHAEGRRAIAKDYNLSSILTKEKYFDEIIQEFISALDKNFAKNGKYCDFTIWSEYFSYDAVTKLVFGQPYGFCNTGTDVDGSLRDLRQMLLLSPFLSYLPWIWPITQTEWVKRTGMNHYARNIKKKIFDRLDNNNSSNHHDLLEGLFKAKYRDGHNLPTGEIINHAYIFILAAPDTVSVALRAILINLSRNRNIYSKVLTELLSLHLSHPPTWKELIKAPLLHAVVKETLRVHPPAGFNLPRAVPAGGRTVCGYYLPEGTTVGMSAWCVHANERFWGKDTLEFKPDRWLNQETSYKLDRFGLSFGQGSRACLGKNIAMVQLVKSRVEKVTAQILLNFEFELVDEHKIRELFLLLVVLDGVKVAFKRRAGGPLDDSIRMAAASV